MSASGMIMSIKVNGIEYPVKDDVEITEKNFIPTDQAGLVGFTSDLIIEDSKTGRKIKAKVLVIETEYEEN